VTITSKDIAESLPGLTISTFGGNPVSTTAAKAVIDLIEEQKLAANAAGTGAYLRSNLEELRRKYSIVGEVRGMGLMQGLELVEDRRSKAPAVKQTLRIMEAARHNRILIGRGGLYGNVLRISPPLNIQKPDVDEFIRRLDASFASLD
jgi:4-aminobutyrate aminotransferase-like enzyme